MNKKYLYIFILFLLLFTSCSSQNNLPYIPLHSEENKILTVENEPDNAIHLGISSVISPQATRKDYQDFVQYLEKKLDKPIILIQGKTYEEMNEMIKEGKVDIALICSLAYVLGKENNYLKGIAAPQVDGNPLYRSYIIVRTDSKLSQLDDLKGKRFAFTDPYSYSGKLSPVFLLHEKGILAKSFFGKIYYTYSHDYSVKAVANGIVDGAAVDSLVYDQMVKSNMEDTANLRIIEYGHWVGTPPIVVSNYIPEEMTNKIKNLLFNMNNDVTGQSILKKLRIEKFVSVDFDRYKSILNMLYATGEKL